MWLERLLKLVQKLKASKLETKLLPFSVLLKQKGGGLAELERGRGRDRSHSRARHDVDVPYMLVPGGDHTMKCLLELMRDGKLKTVIDSKYGLSRCEEAWSKGMQQGRLLWSHSFVKLQTHP